MGRLLQITDGGEVRFFEPIGGGVSYFALKAPALAASLTFTLPAADGTAGQTLQTDGAGTLSFAAGASTLQSAYDAGAATIAESTGKPIAISSAFNFDVLTINKTATGAGEGLQIDDAGTGRALQVTKTGDGYAGFISRNLAASVAIFRIESGGANDRPHLEIAANGAGALARGISCVQVGPAIAGFFSCAGGGLEVLYATSDQAQRTMFVEHSSFGAGDALHVSNSGVGRAAFFDQSAGDNVALHVKSNRAFDVVMIEKTNAGTGDCFQIDDAGTGNAMDINKTGNGHVIDIFKSGVGAGRPITIDNDGTGIGFFMTQDGAADAFDITQSTNNVGITLRKTGSGAGSAMAIDNDGTGFGILIQQDGAGRGLKVLQNGAEKAVEIAQTINDTALFVNKTGAGAGVAIEITNGGTGHDIQGAGSTWFVTPGGNVNAKAFTAVPSAVLTIATGAITVTGSVHSVDTEAAAASDDLDTINTSLPSGTILVLRASNAARTVVVKDGTGNLALAGDFSLNNDEDTITLIFIGAAWYEIARSDNGA